MNWNWTKAPATLLPGTIPGGDDLVRDVSGYTHDLMHAGLGLAAKRGYPAIACEVEGCLTVSGELLDIDTRAVEQLIFPPDDDEKDGRPALQRPIPAHHRYLYPAIPNWWRDQTFETFEIDSENEAARSIADAWASEPAGVLALMGPTGTGKTHLAAAIAHSLQDAHTDISVWEFDGWLDALRDSFSTKDRNEIKAFESRMIRAAVLILDEIRAESTSDAVRETFERVVRARTGEGRPILITTNANEDAWESWSERSYSRLHHKDHSLWVPMVGRDRRRFA